MFHLDSLRNLQEINLSELSIKRVGFWPKEVKFLLLLALFFSTLVVGDYGYLSSQKQVLEKLTTQEANLRADFEKKYSQSSNIDSYRQQMANMEEIFSDLVDQLPSATEVPSLLDDITQRGVINGLRITSIDLQEEQPREFYIELPIKIKAEGGYHDLGAFVSGLAALPRIVTLHDFSLSTLDIKTGLLEMTLQVKTYRYKIDEFKK